MYRYTLMESVMIIYMATNKINGKMYIGQTIMSLTKRRQAHYDAAKRGSKTHFHKAIRKYGRDVFEWTILETASSRKRLSDLETKYINEYNSIKKGYNEAEGGFGGSPFHRGNVVYERIKHKLGKWKNGNPGATKEAIEKRRTSFTKTKWVRGTSHKNTGKTKTGLCGSKNPMFGKRPVLQKIEIDGVVYNSLGEAAIKFDLTRRTIKQRCLSEKYPKWILLETVDQGLRLKK